MKHLLSSWAEVKEQLSDAAHILALVDYDGTLVPIAPRPEMADLPPAARQKLEMLAGKRRFTLGIISGRSLADLKSKVNLDGIIYSGNHGLEIEAPEVRLDYNPGGETEGALRAIYGLLLGGVGKTAGVLIENKGLSLAVHYRGVNKDEVAGLKRAFRDALSRFRLPESLQVAEGKKVYEIRPAGWDKGKAVGLLIERFGTGKRLVPIYMGDDRTDEDAFRALPEDGISVFVGSSRRRSAARFFLRSPSEVVEFLGMLGEG